MENEGDKNMITLFRIIKLFQLKVKWQLAVWQFADKQLTELVKNPEEIEKKVISYLAELIHNEVKKEKESKS